MIKLWKIIGIIAAVGAILMSTGMLLGANTGGIQMGRGGMRVDSNELLHVHFTDLDAFENISINVSSMQVRIVQADYFGFEARYRDNSNFNYSIQNGTINISQGMFYGSQISIMGFGWEREYVTIFVPHDAVFNEVNIRSSSGRVIIESLDCVNLTLNVSSGRIEVDNLRAAAASIRSTSGSVTVSNAVVESGLEVRVSSGGITINNSSADYFELRTTSGRVTVSGIVSNGLSAESSSGRIYLQGILNGENNVRASSGRINIDVDGAESDFNINAHTSSGNVRINGQRGVGVVNNNAGNSISARTASGGVNINFSR